MDTWEYKTAKLKKQDGEGFFKTTAWTSESFTEQLNEYGQQGWELVSHFCTIAPAGGGSSSHTDAVFATFKRKV